MTRVLVVIPAYVPDFSKGGSVTGCRSFVSVLRQAGIHSAIASLDTLHDGVRERDVDGVGVRYFPQLNSLDGLSKSGWGLSPAFCLWLWRNCKSFDLVYFRSLWNFVSLAGPVICRLRGVKFAFCASGKLSGHALQTSSRRKSIVAKMFGRLFSKAAFVHYATQQEADSQQLDAFNDVPALILPPKVASSEADTAPSDEQRVLIYTVSRIDEIKNLEYVISELPPFDHGTGYHYAHFGGGKGEALKDRLEHALAERGARVFQGTEGVLERAAGASFCGHQPIDVVNAQATSPSIFLLMSHSEGLSNAALEAMARGSDVVVSVGSNMREFAEASILTEIKPEPGVLNQLLKERLEAPAAVADQGVVAAEFARNELSGQSLAKRLRHQLERLL